MNTPSYSVLSVICLVCGNESCQDYVYRPTEVKEQLYLSSESVMQAGFGMFKEQFVKGNPIIISTCAVNSQSGLWASHSL